MKSWTTSYLSYRSASLLFGWLASHRNRLRILVLGGKRLSLIILWDDRADDSAERTAADEAAIYRLAYGDEIDARAAARS